MIRRRDSQCGKDSRRALLINLRRGQAFIVAVVPLRQIRLDPGEGSEAGEFAGPARPLARAREHMAEIDAAKTLQQPARILFSLFGQRHLRMPGVSAG